MTDTSRLIDEKPKAWILEYTLDGDTVQREQMVCTRAKAIAYANNYCGYHWTLSEKGAQSLLNPSMESAMEFISRGIAQ